MILINDDLKESELKIETFNYSYPRFQHCLLICNPFFSTDTNINIFFPFPFSNIIYFSLSIALIPFPIISTIVTNQITEWLKNRSNKNLYINHFTLYNSIKYIETFYAYEIKNCDQL